MADRSRIEWTDATWNPMTGCSHASPGCARCFAERLSLRHGWSARPWLPAHAAENLRWHPDRLALPLRWRRPRRIFVNSMSDLFHEAAPDAWRDAVFGIIAACAAQGRGHVFQALTKRADGMAAYFAAGSGALLPRWRAAAAPALAELGLALPDAAWAALPWPLPNLWLGVSVENARWARGRLPALLATPAAVRFVSCEPLLGPVDLTPWLRRLDWVIVGGESGPKARPMDPAWARALRDQCLAVGVPFFLKQLGGPRPGGEAALDGEIWRQWPEDAAPL
ncbi:MAG: phage Gp37/Gp68 family protein [Firmicutes bacterium]|nr:phage Gp37/Gp68 family protein [Bacillota bacterium]